jgi:hypothetical protein
MADPQQLIDQAKSGQPSFSDFIKRKYAGGPPKITDPVAPPVQTSGGGFSTFLKNKYGAQAQQPAAPQQSVAPVQPQQPGLPLAETVPASPEVLEGPGFFKDFLKPSLQDAANMAIENTLPVGLAFMGTTLGGVPGGIIGATAGTYLNGVLGVDEPTWVDYTLNAGGQGLGLATNKVGKAILKRTPSFQAAQQRHGAKIATELSKEIVKRPEKALETAAWQTVDNLVQNVPTTSLQQAAATHLQQPAQKFLVTKMRDLGPQYVDAITDPTKAVLKPTELQRLNRYLKSNITDLYKAGDAASTLRADQLSKVQKTIDNQIEQLASAGDQGAKAILNAQAITRQAKTFDDLDNLLKNTVTYELEKGTGRQVAKTNVNKIYDKVIKAEDVIKRHGKAPGKIGKIVTELMQNPQGYKAFKDGLTEIAKYTPDGNIRLLGKTGGGPLERGVRAVAGELNTGLLTRFLATPTGVKLMGRVLKETNGQLTVPMVGALTATLRPALTGVAAEADPIIQNLSGLVQEGKNLATQAQQFDNQTNQRPDPTGSQGLQ